MNGALVLATSLVLTLRGLPAGFRRRRCQVPRSGVRPSGLTVASEFGSTATSREVRGMKSERRSVALPHARSRASDFVALAKPRLNLLVVASRSRAT